MLEAAFVCLEEAGNASVREAVRLWRARGRPFRATPGLPVDSHEMGREVNRTKVTWVTRITRRVSGISGPVVGCLLAGCSPAADPVEPREVVSDTTADTRADTVQRGSLTVTVTAAGEASQALEALGAPAGRVPSAHVRIRRASESSVLAGTADAAGQVTFTELLPGRYDVTALRLLSADEDRQVSRADSTLTEVNALGGGGRVQVQPPASTTEVEAVAGRRGSLAISEIHDWMPELTSDVEGQYSMARYVEVYNNADTTVFLDGKILGSALEFVWESSLNEASLNHCEDLKRWRLDPDGIWSDMHLRFPGSGREHPVSPGGVRTVVLQAIDHREVHPGPGLPDLSTADFEIVGTGRDVDNPAVPNMEHIGFRPSVDALGRGFIGHFPALFIVDEVDLDSLPTEKLHTLRDPDYRRFPGDRILDLVTVNFDPATFGLEGRFCDRVVGETFERQAATFLDPGAGNSIHRRVLGTTASGHVVLQRTRTSAVDLVRGTRSPGRVP